MRLVLGRDSTYRELAFASGKWLVVVGPFNIDWLRSPHRVNQVHAAIPWLWEDHEGRSLSEGYAVAMCDSAKEANDAFNAVWGPANVERGEQRTGVGDVVVHAVVINPDGEYEIDNIT